MRTAKPLIRLSGCPGWSESSLGALSLCWFCHEAAQMCLTWHRFCIFVEKVLVLVCLNTIRINLICYRKFPKYSDTQNNCCDHSKIWTMWLYHRVMSPNDADGLANSVDPDQSSLIWVCTVCPGISVRKLRIITVFVKICIRFKY